MRAWLYLIAAAIAAGIVATPAVLLFLVGGTPDDAALGSLVVLMLVAGLAVVTMKDIIRCGLAMIVCFLALAGIYVILGAPMVAAAQVLVYTGAISVLILFAIMLTQSKAAPARLVFQTQAVPAAIAAIILAVLVSLAVVGTSWQDLDHRVKTGTDALATVLFSQYVLPFEVVSVLLLAAVIGGVFLAKREEGSVDTLS
jgi:NADH-quinone oxidoreductase subunit J